MCARRRPKTRRAPRDARSDRPHGSPRTPEGTRAASRRAPNRGPSKKCTWGSGTPHFLAPLWRACHNSEGRHAMSVGALLEGWACLSLGAFGSLRHSATEAELPLESAEGAADWSSCVWSCRLAVSSRPARKVRWSRRNPRKLPGSKSAPSPPEERRRPDRPGAWSRLRTPLTRKQALHHPRRRSERRGRCTRRCD
jgi:hypothetical protein